MCPTPTAPRPEREAEGTEPSIEVGGSEAGSEEYEGLVEHLIDVGLPP
jgi:hypothetical protein